MLDIQNEALCVPRPSSGLDCDKLVLNKHPFPSSFPANHILIKVDRFGFSTNNITYQALGEHPHFRYFDYHPISDSGNVSSKTHGLIPVWGFGTVVVSTHPKIQAGERIYGYLSLAKYLLLPITPNEVTKHGFYVSRPHLPADRRPYNQMIRCATDPQYNPDPLLEDLTMLYRPLFWTAYWCEDWLFASEYRGGASYILISSASSKTAFSLAYLIRKRINNGEIKENTKIIGLTSRKNLAFTNNLNLYHEVLSYDAYPGSPLLYSKATESWIYIDVAANENLNRNLFAHFSCPNTGHLAACIQLGITNVSPTSGQSKPIDWSENSAASLISILHDVDASQPGPRIQHFFMPEWLNMRRRQLSPSEIATKQSKAWQELMRDGMGWVKMERCCGVEGVQQAYEKLVRDGVGPEVGLIWSLWEETQIKSRL